MAGKNLQGTGGREGRASRDHFVQDRSERVEVRSPIDLLSPDIFRRRVGGGATDQLAGKMCGSGLRESPVQERHRFVPPEEDVGRFHVPVKDAPRSRRFQCHRDFPGDADRFRFRYPSSSESFLEVLPLQEVHGEPREASGESRLDDGEHPGIPDFGERPDLVPVSPQEFFPHLLVGRLVKVHHLDGHLPVQRNLPRAVDGSHSARPDLMVEIDFEVAPRCFGFHLRPPPFSLSHGEQYEEDPASI